MLKPVYEMKIGTQSFDSANNAEALSINVDSDLAIPLDAFKVVLKPGDKTAVGSGDAVSIKLGYDDAPVQVFTGTVDAVEPGISSVTVSGFSLAAPLTRMRIHQVYEQQTAGNIVKDLASRLSLSIKTVDDGISFPMYVVDESRTVYSHMRELAVLCGFDLFLTPDGEVMFKNYQAKKPVTFTYGEDIIEAQVKVLTPQATSVKVFEESPSSTKGSDTAPWLSKKVMGGVAGSGDEVFIVANPAIRDKDTADSVAAAVLDALMVTLVGTVKTIGEPEVLLSDTIEIKGMPDARMNDKFEVTRVSHAFNMDEGFTTTFGWIKRP
ncbi:MAG TPA: hypothetical protein VMC84_04550 [Methanocella sp.]|uniref:phage late control D family protein n=1 Tax=Methanocella sp. TaxID=2052833 RepID=UPI002C81F6CC|nr:hypothetical protein [Methanocella sp.]HTY90426.1 hypothetical protein [Methanocella sp.]